MDFDIVWDDQLLFGKDVLHLEQRCSEGEWWIELGSRSWLYKSSMGLFSQGRSNAKKVGFVWNHGAWQQTSALPSYCPQGWAKNLQIGNW